MEFSINVKQAVAVVWTVIALIVSLIIVLAIGWPSFATVSSIFPLGWQWLVVLFFGLFLVMTIPVYVLIALWHIVSKWDGS